MQHKQLSEGRWFELSFFEQMSNIGSEIERAISWNARNKDFSNQAIERSLELLFLSINDKKNQSRLKELTRVYEGIGDYFYGDNIFKSNDSLWQKYFYNFSYALRNKIV